MANLASSKKNSRKSLRRWRKNKNVLEKIKQSLKGDRDSFPMVQKLVDKAAKRGIIHKNRAARLKSRRTRRTKEK